MTNNLRCDKVNKHGPYDTSKHGTRDNHYENYHPTFVAGSKKYMEDNTAVIKHVNKQASVRNRVSSVDTDVPPTFYRRVLSSRRETSIGSADISSSLMTEYAATSRKDSIQNERYKPNRYSSVHTLEKNSNIKVHVHNGIKWELTDRYKFIDMVGSGSYGHVCRAYDLQENKFVAIKRIHKVFDDLIDCKRILREIAILNRLDHPNVVRILDILVPRNLETFDVLYVVLEIAASDIKQLVRSPAFLNENHIRMLIYNLLSGVHYLHSVGIYHRDLKPANCLVNRDCSIKICDFGLARTTTLSDGYPEDLSNTGRSLYSSNSIISNTTRTISENTCYTSQSVPDTFRQFYNEEMPQIHRMRLNAQMTRQLTGHVVTRWYRAPELILLQENYTFAIDVWSIGCIFAELLNMMKQNISEPSDRSPLFPGTSCFPLSPDNKNSGNKNSRNTDQLNIIFNVIGTPSEEDVDSIEKPDVRRYVRLFGERPSVNLYERFHGTSGEAIDLLSKMLTFNPSKRITVKEALQHPYFSNITKGKEISEYSEKIRLPFNDWISMSESQLRYAFLREIQRYHDDFKIPVKIIYRS
ncbi:mitogen-activated protein kinase 2, putative [Theileria equi strain WA]|uniref:Mitogen-activated protein kinase n=1 Tax=Theileria equi strain WA TaxID=1537102 RepID=L0AXC4_THEEQ|nr:mitogen-activated protein kinase 2, putative [Theileria equi strain WA]AFZ80232.1 mitogen-activated protein kinase 2, putative [Theileria equi strain WA]|eukprot:XP_004829898.1 mitogen-activated protein kinase 2, putative [Theileria equi strain WA]